MTIFGWDASHFDGALSTATLARARDEGISFFTHKIAEGTQDTEGTTDDSGLAAARAVGIEFLGGYLVPRTYTSVSAQVDFWLGQANASEPWWPEHPGWFWQVDLERWPYDNVPASYGIAAAQELRARTGRWTVLYASHGQYGDQLGGWDGPLWNADYVPGAGPPAALYPGDNWRSPRSFGHGGWATYSGREPTFLQFSSSATIAGLTARDVSAFRGSLDELRQLIEGGTMPNYAANAERYLWKLHIMDPNIDGIDDAGGTVVHSALVDLLTRVDTSVAALQTGGVTQDQVDAAIAKALQDPTVTGAIAAQLGAPLTTLGTKLDHVLSALAAAGREAGAV